MFVRSLALRASLRRWLHEQALQGDRLAAVRTVAVGRGVKTLQSSFHLDNFIEVALLLRAVKFRLLPQACLLLAVHHLVR